MAAGPALVNDPEESRGELQCLLGPVSGTTVRFATFFFALSSKLQSLPTLKGKGNGALPLEEKGVEGDGG